MGPDERGATSAQLRQGRGAAEELSREAARAGELPRGQNAGMSPAMEKLFSDPHYKGFVLQDKKRLPARFYARVSGATTSRLG